MSNKHTLILGNFDCTEFAYILYPFGLLYKLLGFAPIQWPRGELSGDFCAQQFRWDSKAWMWSGLNITIYTIGFCYGISWLHSASFYRGDGISHLTSWAQVFTLFALGLIAWITAWTYMDEQCRLYTLITRIDRRLREIDDIQFDYESLRRRLLWQLGLQLLIAFPLSMVNCIVIWPDGMTFSPLSACYIFICIAPICVLIFKQFQFYSLMHILRTKFDLINKKLNKYNKDTRFIKGRRRFAAARKVNSVSEMALTVFPKAPPKAKLLVEMLNVDLLQNLLGIYSNVSDGIDLLLRSFAWHLLFLTAVSFGVITVQSYNIFSLLTKSLVVPTHHIFFIVSWILAQVMAIAVNVLVCSRTSRTMDTTVSILHKMRLTSNQGPNASIFYQILQLFSMEVMQRKGNFNAAGFFNMDRKLLTSILASSTTYLVIIIQFHLTNTHKCPL